MTRETAADAGNLSTFDSKLSMQACLLVFGRGVVSYVVAMTQLGVRSLSELAFGKLLQNKCRF
jgi:hypothetical protein